MNNFRILAGIFLGVFLISLVFTSHQFSSLMNLISPSEGDGVDLPESDSAAATDKGVIDAVTFNDSENLSFSFGTGRIISDSKLDEQNSVFLAMVLIMVILFAISIAFRK